MFGARGAAFASAMAATILAASAATDAQIEVPAEAFAVLPDRAPSISADGKHFALIREESGRPIVAIYDIGSSAAPLVVKSPNQVIDGILWAKNDVLLIYAKSNRKLGLWDDRNLMRSLGSAAALLLNEKRQVQLSAYLDIVDIDLDDPDIVYAAFGNSVYRVNVRTGTHNDEFLRGLLPSEATSTDRWFFDGRGKPVAREDHLYLRPYDKPHGTQTLKVPDSGRWRDVATYDFTVDHGDGIVGLSEDGYAMIRLATNDKSTAAVTRVDLKDGSETVLHQDPVYDGYVFLTNEWTGRIVGFGIKRDMMEYHFFDPALEALQRGLEQSFPGLSVLMDSADIAKNKVIVRTEGPRSPPTFYLLDRTTHQAQSLVASYPALNDGMLGEVKPYPYKARDGVEIHAYLTLPPGRPAKNLPLIVMPHGGPDARDDMSFDWWAQFLANRGYAVLKPNFRGSIGYGRPFNQAGLHQWGLKMQDDITDGVNKVVADGIADPKRICIVGASYGGYAALAGSTFTPQFYACAVSYAGISNLPDMLGYAKLQNNQDITNGSFVVSRIGDAFADADRLKAMSPALHADRVQAPVLLLHSELDVTVPIYQSELEAKALKAQGKQVEFIRIPGDDHNLSLADTRLRFLRETERFLKAHIGN